MKQQRGFVPFNHRTTGFAIYSLESTEGWSAEDFIVAVREGRATILFDADVQMRRETISEESERT